MRDLVLGVMDGRVVLGSQELKTGSCRDGVEMQAGRTAVKRYCAAAASGDDVDASGSWSSASSTETLLNAMQHSHKQEEQVNGSFLNI